MFPIANLDPNDLLENCCKDEIEP